MRDPNNKRGTRGGRKDRPANKRMMPAGRDDRPSALQSGQPLFARLPSSSATAAAASKALFNDNADVAETAETHLIPRKSLTAKYFLRHGEPAREYAKIKTRQIDKAKLPKHCRTVDEALAASRMIETTENRVAWTAPKTLLDRSKAGAMPKSFGREGAMREGQNTRKFKEVIQENPVSADVIEHGIYTDDEDLYLPPTE